MSILGEILRKRHDSENFLRNWPLGATFCTKII